LPEHPGVLCNTFGHNGVHEAIDIDFIGACHVHAAEGHIWMSEQAPEFYSQMMFDVFDEMMFA